MKQLSVLFAILFTYILLSAQPVATRTDILNMVSLVSADSVQSTIQHLQDYQTRYAAVDNHLDIANWISSKFQQYGFTNTYLQDYEHWDTTQYNVIATLTGSIYPDIFIIVGGHYDSWSGNSDPMVYAPGADDNASGTAGTLEIARVMMAMGFQPKCSIRFIAFSAEEGWAYGSEAYCQEAASQNQNIRLMVNLDMIANNPLDSTQYRVMPYEGFLEHSIAAIEIAQQYTTLQPVLGYMNEGSDSIMFWQWGYPPVFFFEYDISPWYHSSDDVIANLDIPYCAEIIRGAASVAATYADKPLSPTELRVLDTGTGNSLAVQWELSADASVDYYKVYYGMAEDSLAFWQSVGGDQCQITGLTAGLLYHIAVSSVNNLDSESVRIHSSGTPLATPLTPSDLSEHPLANSISLSWSPNSELDLQGYHVYRSLSPDEPGASIATVNAPEISYLDTDVVGTNDYYCYRISSIDAQGNESALSAAVQSRPVSLNMGILVIDESKNFGGTSPFQPTDLAVDTFYDAMLEDFTDVMHLDLETQADTLRLADIGVYSSLLWHGNDNADVTYPYETREILSQYIALGGNALFSLYQPSKAFELNASYPAVFDPDSFISDVLGISGANYGVTARFGSAIPNMTAFAYLQVDSLKTLAAWNGHIFGVESIEPLNPAENVYAYGSDYPSDSPQGVLNGQSVGVLHHHGTGQAVTLSFPLFNMQEASSMAMVEFVFGSLFNESTQAEDDVVPGVSRLILQPNYPNPFCDATSFRIIAKDTHSPLRISVYNLKGQLVQVLHSGIPGTNTLHSWDGKDALGIFAGSGIYFLQATQNGMMSTRKILLIRQ